MSRNWKEGLSARSSVGGFGTYRDCAREDTYCLTGLVWTSGLFHTYGNNKPVFSLELPDNYSYSARNHSWTGMTLVYANALHQTEVELRSTLPGPLLRTLDFSLRLRWSPGSDPRFCHLIDKPSPAIDTAFSFRPGESRLWHLRTDSENYLLVLSQPVREVEVISHRHWNMRFAQPGASVLIVPLLDLRDAEKVLEHRKLWLSLVERPPIECNESFEVDGQTLRLLARFPRASLAPVPPTLALLEQHSSLFTAESGPVLVSTVFGPYRVVESSYWEARIDLEWARTGMKLAHTAKGELSALPEELHYPGDCTWNENEPLDQLLSLRAWAPVLRAAPDSLAKQLRARLRVPTAKAFRDSLLQAQEPHVRRFWARDKTMWDDRGDACYDPDWYNGLSLSGLARAAQCGDVAITRAARELAASCRAERELLCNYFEIYFDWMLSVAWTDPRGLLWLPDCAHNGLEGLIGEYQLCELEGRVDRAERILYVAAKTACGLMASLYHGIWIKHTAPALIRGYQPGDAIYQKAPDDERLFGLNGLYLPKQAFPTTPATRAPYIIAGHFPEYAALLKKHGPVAALRELAAIWEREFSARYADWLEFYLGRDWRKRPGDQEARIQAAVFYHVAPDVSTRLWVLDQSPEKIEALYQTPLPLAEQLLLRSAATLQPPPKLHLQKI